MLVTATLANGIQWQTNLFQRTHRPAVVGSVAALYITQHLLKRHYLAGSLQFFVPTLSANRCGCVQKYFDLGQG